MVTCGVNGDGMQPKLLLRGLEVVNIAIQTLSDDWNLLSIQGRQSGAKGKSPASRFPAIIPQTYTAKEIEARIGVLGSIVAVLRGI